PRRGSDRSPPPPRWVAPRSGQYPGQSDTGWPLLLGTVARMFSPAVQAWFDTSFAAPTDAQIQGWPAIANGDHTLLLAPTGSGKTLAAFLWAIDRLGASAQPD